MDNLSYFPKDYADSRRRWHDLEAVVGYQAFFGSCKIPGTKDNDLYYDNLTLPPTKENGTLIVLSSGVHGSESYAGSAVLQMFLREILPTVDRSRIGFFIAHNLNPYGFKHHQRCTESGVNLNRNFSVKGDMFARQTPEALRFNEMFIPKKPVDSHKSYWLSTMEMKNGRPFVKGIPLDEFTKAVSPGQFDRKEYTEYGGKKHEPQSEFFVYALKEVMPAFKDVIGLDIHTGLGERGRLHILAGGGNERVDQALFNQLFHAKDDAKFYEYTPPEADGFYEVFGGINAAFVDVAKPDQRVCAVTMEFGTLGHSFEKQIEGTNMFFLEHQGQYYGYATPEIEREIKAENFARSYPDDPVWKNQVIDAARETIKRVVARALKN